MSPVLALRIATYLLAADGVAALLLAGIVGPVGASLVGAALALSLGQERVHRRLAALPGLDRRLGAVLALALVAVSLLDLLYLAETVLDGLVHLLLLLIVARLFTLRSPRDTRVVAFLSFFMLVAASSATFGVGFLVVFIAFLLLCTWMLLLQHVLSETEPAPNRTVVGVAAHLIGGPALLGLAGAATAATLVITAALFFVIPRVGLAALPVRARMGPMVTGFSDRVELGAYGQIETDASVAMRVHIPEGTPAPEQIPGLRWRGIVFDKFDGHAWTVGRPERMALRRATAGPASFRLGIPLGRGRTLVQEVYLEPIGTDILFAAPRALRVTIRADELDVDDMASLSVASASARLHYIVESELGDGPVTFPASVHDLDAASARYLQLPALPARIGALARQVTAGSRDPYEAARRLTQYLAREYRYTLALERKTTLDPVDEFLFVRRSGNCEYFAASLAVMLRTLGIPSRVVGGFQRGEWNPYGRYFTVRMRDAHSWVEAYIGGLGWVTLDASPRGDAETAPSAWILWVDALKMSWYRYVINWSLRDQVEVAVTIRRQAVTWRLSLSSLGGGDGLRRWLLPGAGLVAAALVGLSWRRRRRTPVVSAVSRMPKFYARGLKAVGRRGLRPAPGETAREFSARVAGAAPAWAAPFDALTVLYERARFGGAVLGRQDLQTAEAILAALSSTKRG